MVLERLAESVVRAQMLEAPILLVGEVGNGVARNTTGADAG